MSLKCGVVGLPNVGKSTIFKALTNAKAEVANFPFCTIDPNQGAIIVPDERLDALTKMFNPKVTTPTTVEIVDIAGLVKGASKGEGLGNQFLSQIREVDAICHIVRCFDDQDIVHVHGKINPIQDIEIIETELALKDLETITKKFEKTEKVFHHEQKAKLEFPVLKKIKQGLEEGLQVRKITFDKTEIEIVKELNLLTSKPVLYVANVGETDLPLGGKYSKLVEEYAKKENSGVIFLCGKIELELAELEDQERKEFLESYGLKRPGKYELINAVFKLLGLITYFTAGEKEVRAWDIIDGTKAPKAAGVIHTDFERGFISAETVNYNDLIKCESYYDAKNNGLVRLEGKEYVMKDGDCCIFRFSV